MTGKRVEWDGERQVVTNDRSIMQNASYRREHCKPWSLPASG